eukprot:1309-Heterococcus_DN1.PRE.1
MMLRHAGPYSAVQRVLSPVHILSVQAVKPQALLVLLSIRAERCTTSMFQGSSTQCYYQHNREVHGS